MSLRAALYCRLSQEDREKPQPGQESQSIQNQRYLLLHYAEQMGWKVAEIYVDDDYSGSDRQRPAFRRLLADAEAGRFDLILCKSQSRFTRELELVEKYLHGLFPLWGIRFVSVTDHVDTAEAGGRKARQLGGLINQWYLEDLSDSVKAVLREKQRQGCHIGSFAPYGYAKDPQRLGHLLPDPEAAAVVQRIYRDFLAGESKCSIAGALNQERIPTPARYKALHGSAYRGRGQGPAFWRGSTVSAILHNPVYRGAVAQHRFEKPSYKSAQLRALPPEDWLVVENCHQPLVPLEQWQQAQLRSTVGQKPPGGGRSLFAGKLRCLLCGASLRRCKSNGQRGYYRCAGAQVHSGCEGGFIPEEELKRRVWAAFQRQLEQNVPPEGLPRPQQERLLQRQQENAAARQQLYWDFLHGQVEESWYRELSRRLRLEEQSLGESLAHLAQPQLPQELDRELVALFIREIRVGRRDKESGQVPLKIFWNF